MGYLVDESTSKEKEEKGLRRIIGAFKSITTVEYIKGVKEQDWPAFNKKVWQRNYWERVIRTKTEYENDIRYIHTNPARRKRDCFAEYTNSHSKRNVMIPHIL